MTAPCGTTILYPTTGGNIHCFKALTPCALFDVLSPPYSSEDGRHCSYFRRVPGSVLPGIDVIYFYSSSPSAIILNERKNKIKTLLYVYAYFLFAEGAAQLCGIEPSEVAWLEETQPPENFVVQRGLYKGPNIRR